MGVNEEVVAAETMVDPTRRETNDLGVTFETKHKFSLISCNCLILRVSGADFQPAAGFQAGSAPRRNAVPAKDGQRATKCLQRMEFLF